MLTYMPADVIHDTSNGKLERKEEKKKNHHLNNYSSRFYCDNIMLTAVVLPLRNL